MSILRSIMSSMENPRKPNMTNPAPVSPATPKVGTANPAKPGDSPAASKSQRGRPSPSAPAARPPSSPLSYESPDGIKRRKLQEEIDQLKREQEARRAEIQRLDEQSARMDIESKRLQELKNQRDSSIEAGQAEEPSAVAAAQSDEERELAELQKCVISDKDSCLAAIAFLRKQEVIAADCEWITEESGQRRLSLVQVATAHREELKQRTYLFDIFVGGADIFDWGLREIMESAKIIKIFHDCRWDSRILWTEYRCKLTKVYDTQVAYCVYSRQQTLTTPFPISLNRLLERYAFGVTNKYKDIAKAEMEADPLYWIRRPLSLVQLHYAREDVLKLPVVYRQINAASPKKNIELIENYSQGYAKQLRDMKDEKQLEERYKKPTDGSRARPMYGIPFYDDEIARSFFRKDLRETARLAKNPSGPGTLAFFPSTPSTDSTVVKSKLGETPPLEAAPPLQQSDQPAASASAPEPEPSSVPTEPIVRLDDSNNDDSLPSSQPLTLLGPEINQ